MSGLQKALAVILVVWMAGTTYGWVCKVKNHCCDEESTIAQTSQQAAIGGVQGGLQVDAAEQIDSDLASQTDTKSQGLELIAPITLEPGPEPLNPALAMAQSARAEQINAAANIDIAPLAVAPEPESESVALSPAVVVPAIEASETVVATQPEARVDWLFSKIEVPNLNGGNHAAGTARFEANASIGQVESHVEDGLLKLVTQLTNDPSRNVLITGGFYTDESNPSSFENLGLARAQVLANRLAREDEGLDKGRFQLSYQSYPPLPKGEAIDIETAPRLLNIVVLDSALKAQGSTLPADLRAPIVLNFETGKSYVKLSERLRERISKAIAFLNVNPSFGATLVGYTDDQGLAENNLKLGLSRARSSEQLLQQFGLQSRQIRVSSQGESNPVMPNTSPANRALNRRVVFQLISPTAN